MKHHKKPEHYSAITEMINKARFDDRKAYKETVHNELIKDQRFILIGRGIYALSEWGFKPGVVADVIVEILKQSGQPMPKEKIIEEVLKSRMVKKNTILVGLSNKKLFQKVGKNSYALV
jgi:DNA-directed RNA polymerase delta subunit